MTLCTRRVGHGAVVAAMALWLVACGGSSKSTSPTTEAGANAPVGSTSTPSTTASAPPSTTKTSAPPATTSPATVAPAASPTEAVDQFLAAEKAYDCSTAFSDFGSNLRASVGGTAAALCTALHKDPVSSFKPSTLINGGSNSVVKPRSHVAMVRRTFTSSIGSSSHRRRLLSLLLRRRQRAPRSRSWTPPRDPAVPHAVRESVSGGRVAR
jgi:hypothetical protein